MRLLFPLRGPLAPYKDRIRPKAWGRLPIPLRGPLAPYRINLIHIYRGPHTTS